MLTYDPRRASQAQNYAVTVGTLAIACVAIPAPAFGQAVAPPTREELDPGRALRPADTGGPRLSVEGDIERGPCPLADPVYANVIVNFSSVGFGNLTAVSPDVLRPAWAEFAGRDLPVATLCEVRDRAATILRHEGFLAAVQVPPQRIEKGGEVHMDVLVAKLVDVQVRGDTGHAEKLIAAHLAKLTAQPFFNVNDAERQLLLLRDLPGYDVRLVLRPAGSAPGEVVGDVVVKRTPLEVIAAVQNLGAKATGREGGFAQVTLNDLTGLGDRTVLSVYNTAQVKEQTVVQLAHDFALGANGLRLGGKLVYGRGDPDLAGGKIHTRTWIGQLALSYPVVRRQALSLLGSGGLEAVDQKVRFASTPLNEDKLRVLFARLDLDAIDRSSLRSRGGFTASEPRWRATAGLELRQGLNALGASKRCDPLSNCLPPNTPISNFFADPSATVVRFDGAFEFRPKPTVTFVLSPRAQYSGSQLLSYEQFSLGNYTVGRGLDPGIVQGDSGVGSGFEVRIGRITPKSDKALTIQPYGFVDAAWAWNSDGGITHDPRRVLSAGGGVRGRWGDHADFNLTFAAPLEKAGFQTKRGDVHVLFTITARLVPWSTK